MTRMYISSSLYFQYWICKFAGNKNNRWQSAYLRSDRSQQKWLCLLKEKKKKKSKHTFLSKANIQLFLNIGVREQQAVIISGKHRQMQWFFLVRVQNTSEDAFPKRPVMVLGVCSDLAPKYSLHTRSVYFRVILTAIVTHAVMKKNKVYLEGLAQK